MGKRGQMYGNINSRKPDLVEEHETELTGVKLYSCTPENCIMLFINVTPINFNK